MKRLFVCFDLCHRKKEEYGNETKQKENIENYSMKNDIKNHLNGKLNQFSVICTVIYQKLSTTLKEKQNFFLCVTNKHTKLDVQNIQVISIDLLLCQTIFDFVKDKDIGYNFIDELNAIKVFQFYVGIDLCLCQSYFLYVRIFINNCETN